MFPRFSAGDFCFNQFFPFYLFVFHLSHYSFQHYNLSHLKPNLFEDKRELITFLISNLLP
jgi:hypothetical protein